MTQCEPEDLVYSSFWFQILMNYVIYYYLLVHSLTSNYNLNYLCQFINVVNYQRKCNKSFKYLFKFIISLAALAFADNTPSLDLDSSWMVEGITPFLNRRTGMLSFTIELSHFIHPSNKGRWSIKGIIRLQSRYTLAHLYSYKGLLCLSKDSEY